MSPTFDRRALIMRSAATATMAALSSRLPAAAQTADADEAALADAITGFAMSLYRALREIDDGNILVSPYSVAMALTMTSAGAHGDTKAQMDAVLGFDEIDVPVHPTFADLTADLTERGNVEADEEEGRAENGLRIANALWGEQTYPFATELTEALAAKYGAGLKLVDFKADPEGARDDINDWVEEQTEDRIQDIVPEGAITAATRLVLANAIWFYGAWRFPFEEDNTRDEPFHLPDADPVDVPFMSQTETFAYAALDTMQVLDVPYASDGFSMTIILPDDGQFEAVEDALDPAMLQDAIDVLEYSEIRLHLPKFEFEYAASLADPLRAMGMDDAFSPDRANFTGMIEGGTPPAGENLFIGDVLHKAFIAVDEEGTEAAAATVVIMVGAGAPDPTEPPEVRLDRPFLFAIRDTVTGAILFLGRVLDPRG